MEAMTKKKKILAIGGGFASVKLALELGKDDNFDVSLIAPHDQIEYHGALYRSATGRSPLEVVLPFREVFKHTPNVNRINDFVTELRAAEKEVKGLSGNTYEYDALVLGLGYEKEYFNTKGAREHTESMYTIFDSMALRNRMRDVFIKKHGQTVNIVIVGAGPTGLELAGDVATFADIVAEQFDTQKAKPHVTVVDRAPRVLPMLSEAASKIAEDRMKELGIKFKGSYAVDHCTSRHLCLTNGPVLHSDIIIWTAGSRANSFFERYPDIFTLDPKKRVVVSEYQQANNPNIYVLGDAASSKYSGMAQTAITDAIQLADNFKHFVRGQELIPYKDHPPIVVVPIGPNWALSPKGNHILTGESGWKVRREADFYVLNNFLDKTDATRHWEKGLQIARLGDV